MDFKIPLVSGKIVSSVSICFVGGIILGCFDVFSLVRQDDTASAEEMPTASRRSFILEKTVDRENVHAPASLTAENRGAFQKYLTFLPPQQFFQEYQRLNKYLKEEYKGRKKELYFLSDYLGYELGVKCPEEVKKIMEEEQTLLGHMLQGWAQTDFQGAVDYLMEHRLRSEDSQKIFDNLCAGLARSDPEKAMNWCLAQSEETRTLALLSVTDAIGAYHPDLIAEFVEKLPEKDISSSQLLEKIARNWGAADWESAMSWIEKLPEKSKKTLMDVMFLGAAEYDLAKASLIFQKLNQTPADAYRLAKIAIASNSNSREGVLEWLQNNVAEHSRASELSSSALWSDKYQSMELDLYVLNMPEGKLRDGAVKGILTHWATHWEYPVYEDKERFQNVPGLINLLKEEESKRLWRSRLMVKCICHAPEVAKKWITEDYTMNKARAEELIQECEKSRKNPKRYVYPYAF